MSSYGQGGGRPWRRIRQQVLDRDHHECQLRLPGCTFIGTEVHHRGAGITACGLRRADADDADLCVAVCRTCHDKVTAKQRAVGIAQAAALRRQRLRPTQKHPGDMKG